MEPADITSRLFLCPDLRGYAILICGCLTPCGALMRPQPSEVLNDGKWTAVFNLSCNAKIVQYRYGVRIIRKPCYSGQRYGYDRA